MNEGLQENFILSGGLFTTRCYSQDGGEDALFFRLVSNLSGW